MRKTERANIMTLHTETYVPEGAIFPIASTLIYGAKEAVLINAQFQASKARELAARIKATGRDLTVSVRPSKAR
ncbi:MAG TPA: hypothetical protein PK417_13765 [Hyphomonas sp.]|nr:hypothetical protein [Hyphomonas sp.]